MAPASPRFPRSCSAPRHPLAAILLFWIAWFLVDLRTGHAAPHSTPLTVTGPAGQAGLVPVPPAESGILFTNVLNPMDAARNQIRLNGSGVAAGDIDADGRVDLFFAGDQGGSRLYRNLGAWRFTDVTEAAGVRLAGISATGACLVDVDGDGDLDLLVNSLGGGTRLLANDGTGRFSEVPDSGLGRQSGATSLALADVDRDGDLDLYVANYRTNTIRSSGFMVLNVNGKRVVRPEDRHRLEYLPDGRILEHGEPDVLYRNNGKGRFEPVPWTEGTFLDPQGTRLPRPPLDWTLSAAFRDVNRDGAPDLYVCGDFHSPDRLWLNRGRGIFQEAPWWVLRNTPTFSMAVDFADVDRDGHDDFLVADMRDPRHEYRMVQSPGAMAIAGDFELPTDRPQFARNVLQWNRGDATFAEVASFAGLDASGWTWSAVFLDVDLDGYEDVLTATGHLFDTQDLDAQERIDANGPYRMDQIPGKLLQYPSLLSHKLAFRNHGSLRFEDVSAAWGWHHEAGVWQGVCLADLDNDGDLDVAVNRLNGPAGVYRNDATRPRVLVRLKGTAPNTHGIGARLELSGAFQIPQTQEMSAGGRYLSGDDAVRVFAAGSPGDRLTLEVRWPSGRRSRVTGILPNHAYVVDERDATDALESPTSPAPGKPLFADETARLGHRHFESPFDDFERQPLLPRRLSRAGPGVGWIDLDGDGRDDLLIAAGRGGRPGMFLNDGQGGFQLVEAGPVPRDQIGVVGWAASPGPTVGLMGLTTYEAAAEAPADVMAYDSRGAAFPTLGLGPTSAGPLALADADGDGDLDLFVGGGAIGGRYPEASPSRLFERHGDAWRESEVNRTALAGVGLVNGAVWSDLDQDGFPELVLACEWGPVRVFRNQRGHLQEITRDLGLDTWTGWWTGVQAGDVDGDGSLDLVAGNWGLNTANRPTSRHPLRLYYGDLAGQSHVELVEAAYDPILERWTPQRDLAAMARQLPWSRELFPTHRLYGRSGVEVLLARSHQPPQVTQATCLASMVWLNRGRRFEPLPLPTQAQITPVFGLNLADFDLDGRLDLFLAQNFFAVSPAVARQDAGRGLLLRGRGDGTFEPVGATLSGLAIYGEQRGSACGDYDGDGRPDLVVTQNGAETRLFRNQAAATGVRIRFRGPPGNPLGIGAVVRLRSPTGSLGPAQELHAGSGYASQDAPAVWVPQPSAMATLEARWPGGITSTHPLPPGSGGGTLILDHPGLRSGYSPTAPRPERREP